MPLPLYVVDAFTSEPFKGNPAAVCLLDRRRDDAWMQSVAAEMNLSETAFVCREENGWRLRWFTPRVEVNLCGHATLATTHILAEAEVTAPHKPITFHTRSGPLACTSRGDRVEMDFPAEPPTQDVSRDELSAVIDPSAVVSQCRNRADYLVELASEAAVLSAAPDFDALAGLPAEGLIITARSDDAQFDFVSRFFAPTLGIDEDPVTGSAHCCLGPYWGATLSKTEMVGRQVSRRGGVVGVRLAGDRAILTGRAVTVMRAQLFA